MKFELSYTISGQGRTFRYYFGLFGLINSLIDLHYRRKRAETKRIKWKIVTEDKNYARIKKT